MKNKHLVMLLLSSCCLAACVDSKYDLSDVNTDDAVMGESWVAPLGTGYVTSDDVVNVEKVPSIREVDGAYVMIYDGEMKIKGKSLRAASDKVEIASEDITTGDIDGLFDGDFVLALTNPHITLKSNVKNASLDCSLSIEAENASKKEATSSDFTLSTVSPNIWIGPLDPKTDAFTGPTSFIPRRNSMNAPAVPTATIITRRITASASMPCGVCHTLDMNAISMPPIIMPHPVTRMLPQSTTGALESSV